MCVFLTCATQRFPHYSQIQYFYEIYLLALRACYDSDQGASLSDWSLRHLPGVWLPCHLIHFLKVSRSQELDFPEALWRELLPLSTQLCCLINQVLKEKKVDLYLVHHAKSPRPISPTCLCSSIPPLTRNEMGNWFHGGSLGERHSSPQPIKHGIFIWGQHINVVKQINKLTSHHFISDPYAGVAQCESQED